MDVSENSGTPKSSILIRVFHYKPSISGYPYFWKHPYITTPVFPYPKITHHGTGAGATAGGATGGAVGGASGADSPNLGSSQRWDSFFYGSTGDPPLGYLFLRSDDGDDDDDDDDGDDDDDDKALARSKIETVKEIRCTRWCLFSGCGAEP